MVKMLKFSYKPRGTKEAPTMGSFDAWALVVKVSYQLALFPGFTCDLCDDIVMPSGMLNSHKEKNEWT